MIEDLEISIRRISFSSNEVSVAWNGSTEGLSLNGHITITQEEYQQNPAPNDLAELIKGKLTATS